VHFYREPGNQGIFAKDIPVIAFSVGEEELAGIDTKPLVGRLAAWYYFEWIKLASTRNSSPREGVHQESEASPTIRWGRT